MPDAIVNAIDGRAVVRVGGSEMIDPYVGQALTAAAEARDDRDAAELAAAVSLAASRYFPSKAAGETGSTTNQLFSTDDGAGNLIYYRKNASGSTEIGRAVTPAALAASDGASRIGTSYGPGFPYISLANVLRQDLHIDKVGAYGDDPNADTAAFQEAIEFLSRQGAGGIEGGGGRLRMGLKRYQLNDTVAINTGVFLKGLVIEGEGTGTVIEGVAPGIPVLRLGGELVTRQTTLRDFSLQNKAGGGHLIEGGQQAAVLFKMLSVNMAQHQPDKHLIYAPYGEVYDSEFRGGDWYHHPNAIVPAVKVRTQNTTFNENIFENLRCLQSHGAPFFDIENEAPDSWLVNNTFRNINFGICRGGGMRVCNARNWTMQNFSFWDTSVYQGHLIHFDGNGGYNSASNTLQAIGRNGNALGSGIHDIFLEAASDTVLINCFTQAADNPSVNFNNNTATVIGRIFGMLNAANVAIILPDGLTLPGYLTALGDAVVGGKATVVGNINTYGRVFVDEVPVLNSQLPAIGPSNDPKINEIIDLLKHHGLCAS